MKILAIGDVVSEGGVSLLEARLRQLIKEKQAEFTVVNGENAAGIGITRRDAERIYGAGANVITLGNHAFSKYDIIEQIEDDRYMLRPANFTARNPGRGFGVFDGPRGLRICVMNLIGRAYTEREYDSPFYTADRLLAENLESGEGGNIIIVDFHADATSEKAALGRYLDGRVSVVYGTHTHVQTADERIFPGGTGFITDIGMSGPVESVLGMSIETSVERFLGSIQTRYRAAEGVCEIRGALFDIDEKTGKCLSVERIKAM